MSKTLWQIRERIGQSDNYIPVAFCETEEEARLKRTQLRGLTSKSYAIGKIQILDELEVDNSQD